LDGEEQRRKKRGCWEAQWRRGMVGSGGQRAAERPPPFVPAVTKAGELREEAVAGRCGGRRGREEAATLVVEVEVRRPERALELAHAPTRPRLGT